MLSENVHKAHPLDVSPAGRPLHCSRLHRGLGLQESQDQSDSAFLQYPLLAGPWSYGVVHTSGHTRKQIETAFYNKTPHCSCWWGCSVSWRSWPVRAGLLCSGRAWCPYTPSWAQPPTSWPWPPQFVGSWRELSSVTGKKK